MYLSMEVPIEAVFDTHSSSIPPQIQVGEHFVPFSPESERLLITYSPPNAYFCFYSRSLVFHIPISHI